MMKVAVACEGSIVSGHFGHCQNFMIYDVEDHKVVGQESLMNPGHKPGFLPKFLKEQNAEVIIAGGMGAKAVTLFNQENIEVVTGAMGLAKDVILSYLNGSLETTGDVCHSHEHADSCGNH